MKLSIRQKILFGFGVILAVSLFTQYVGMVLTEQYIRYQTEKNLQEKAQNAADQIQNFISKIELEHLGIAKEYVANPASVNEIIQYTIRQNIFFQRISVLSLTGKELVKIDRSGIIPRDSLSFEIPSDAFTEAAKGQVGISKVYFTQDETVPYIDMYTPALSEQKTVIGVVKGQLRIDQLWDIIAKSNLGKSGFSYVVDEEGRLIAHPDTALVKTGPIYADRPIVASLLHLKYDALADNTYLNEKNTQVFAQGYRIPDTHWAVIAERPVSDALKDVEGLRTMVITTFTGSLLLLIFVALLISRGITQPLKELTRSAKDIEDGKFDTTTTIESGDELENLGTTFNHMSQELKRYVAELHTKITELEEEKKNLDEAVPKLMKDESELRLTNIELEKEKGTIVAERNKLAVILSGIHDAVIAVDLERKIILFNTAAETITGLKKDDVLGKPIGEILHPTLNTEEIPVETYAPIHDDTFEGILYDQMDVQLTHASGDKKTARLIAAKISESKQSNLGCIIALHDMTLERKLEEMKLDFVSMAAHELRTPLTIIRGYAQTLQEETKATLPESQQEYLNRVLISVQTLAELIDNLLNVSRIEQGKFKVVIAPLQVKDVLRELLTGFASVARSRSQQLEPNIADDLPIIMADRVRITQVLSNLIANAINYTQQNGNIKICAEKIRKDDKDFLKVSIQDNGPGIPKDAIPHLFTKFFRVSGSLEQGSKGTGLGLYISKSIITLHGGDIWVESELGHGATFTFTIPAATEEQLNHSKEGTVATEHGIILNEERNPEGGTNS